MNLCYAAKRKIALGVFLSGVFTTITVSFAEDAVAPKPLPQGKVKISDQWRECNEDRDCAWVHYGCGEKFSVNRAFIKEASEKAYREGGDPRAMDCAFNPGPPEVGAIEVLCREMLCGVFAYPRCKDQSCSKIYPQCMINKKFFLDPKKKDSYGASQTAVWGPLKMACLSRCKKEINSVRERISSPNQGLYEFECQLDGKTIHKDQIKGFALPM